MSKFEILPGDCLQELRTLPKESVNCVVTSPPYWGLRDYGTPGQMGLESTPEEYVSKMVEVFHEVRSVLRDDGTLWLNIGDSYCSTDKWGGGSLENTGKQTVAADGVVPSWEATRRRKEPILGLKPKDLAGIPWMLAFALRADGWYLRQDIIWAKPNPMPESVRDRCTRSHEYLFLLTKSAKYYCDMAAIAEPLVRPEEADRKTPAKFGGADKCAEAFKLSRLHSGNEYKGTSTGTRNKRDVWWIAPKPYRGAHFATFPPALVEPCILAGCPIDGVVLDPFSGAGTTGVVALKHGRNFIGIELKPEYCEMARRRIEASLV